MRFTTSIRRLGGAAAAATLCALAAPAASVAATADTGTAAESNHVEISFDFTHWSYVLSDTGVSSIALTQAAQMAHCMVAGTTVFCPWGSIRSIDLQLGGGSTGYARSSLE